MRDKSRSLFSLFSTFIAIFTVSILSYPFNLMATPMVVLSFALIIIEEFKQDQKPQDQELMERKMPLKLCLIILVIGLVAGIASDWLIEQISPFAAPPYGKPKIGHGLAFVLGLALIESPFKAIRLERPSVKFGYIVSRITGIMLLSNLAIDVFEDYVAWISQR